jgi:hypothetical protein
MIEPATQSLIAVVWKIARRRFGSADDPMALALFLRHSIRIDVATQGTPAGGDDLFATNAFVLRCEIPVGVGILRPQAFAVIALGGGS